MRLKRIIEFLFGAKLPCGHGSRKRRKLGNLATCSFCGSVYRRVRFERARVKGQMAVC